MERARSLVERLYRDADAEATRRVEAARTEAAERVAAAQAAAAEMAAAAIATRRRTLVAESRVATEALTRTASRTLGVARSAAVARVRDAMRVQLDALGGAPDAPTLFHGMLREVRPFLPEGPLVAYAAASVAEALRTELPDVRIIDDARIPFGAVLGDVAGRLRVNVTLSGRLDRAGAPLAILIAGALDALPTISAVTAETTSDTQAHVASPADDAPVRESA